MAKKIRTDRTLRLLLSSGSAGQNKNPTKFQKKSAKDYWKSTKKKWI